MDSVANSRQFLYTNKEGFPCNKKLKGKRVAIELSYLVEVSHGRQTTIGFVS